MKNVNCIKCNKLFKLDNWRYERAVDKEYNLYCSLSCKPEHTIDKFWSNVDIKSSKDFWNLINVTGSSDYGKIMYKNKNYSCNRFSYELKHGPVNNNKLLVCHKCDNPRCVNPDHLFLGTAQDNTDDCISKGRMGYQKKLSQLKIINM